MEMRRLIKICENVKLNENKVQTQDGKFIKWAEPDEEFHDIAIDAISQTDSGDHDGDFESCYTDDTDVLHPNYHEPFAKLIAQDGLIVGVKAIPLTKDYHEKGEFLQHAVIDTIDNFIRNANVERGNEYFH